MGQWRDVDTSSQWRLRVADCVRHPVHHEQVTIEPPRVPPQPAVRSGAVASLRRSVGPLRWCGPAAHSSAGDVTPHLLDDRLSHVSFWMSSGEWLRS